MNIYCLPYAGCSSITIYSKYKVLEKDNAIKIIPLELSGKGARFEEKLNTSIEEIVNEMVEYIIENTKNKNCIVWGHSMGGLLAYEITYELLKKNHINVKALIISGSNPPFIKSKSIIKYKERKDRFINYLIDNLGISKEIAQDDIFQNIFYPIIKNDFELLDKYVFIDKKVLDLKVLILYSEVDNQNQEMYEWTKLLSNASFKKIQGSHYFINENSQSVIEEINKFLNCIDI